MSQISEIAPDIIPSRVYSEGIYNSINFSCATSSPGASLGIDDVNRAKVSSQQASALCEPGWAIVRQKNPKEVEHEPNRVLGR